MGDMHGQSRSVELLNFVDRDEGLSELLASVFEFDTRRRHPDGRERLACGQALYGIAGDFTGGAFYLCGSPEGVQPVLYASSEGQAGLISDNLVEAFELMVGLPYWRDCLTYSGGGDLSTMEIAARHLQSDLTRNRPHFRSQQSFAAQALSLDILPLPRLLSRLRDSVARSLPDYRFIDETGEYEGLFGPFFPDRNKAWYESQ